MEYDTHEYPDKIITSPALVVTSKTGWCTSDWPPLFIWSTQLRDKNNEYPGFVRIKRGDWELTIHESELDALVRAAISVSRRAQDPNREGEAL